MRSKIAVLAGVLAVAMAAIAPAAQAVSFKSGGVPLAPNASVELVGSNPTFSGNWGGYSCSPWKAKAEVGVNNANPATLKGLSGALTCWGGPGTWTGSVAATGPVEVFSDGTSKLPLKFTATLMPGSINCTFQGTGTFTGDLKTPSSYADISVPMQGPGCPLQTFSTRVTLQHSWGALISIYYP